MTKNVYMRANGHMKADIKSFGNNGALFNRDNYFTIYNKEYLNYCWLFIANDFDKFLCLQGKCQFELFFGNLKINGVDFMSPLKENIYSPISHPLITIEVGRNSNNSYKSLDECVKYLSSTALLNDGERELLVSLLNMKGEISEEKKWIAVRIETLKSSVCDDITQIKDFRKLFDVNLEFPFSNNLKFSITKEEEPSYIISEEITNCIDTILRDASDSPISELSLALAGPKDSGKSSLMRYFINNLFANGCKEVCIIDADPGQSEFSPSGCLTLIRLSKPLFGPPFINQFSPGCSIVRQFFLGDTSPNNDPKLYCRSFESLYHSYLKMNTSTKAPLIINTMGWTQGLGLILLAFKLLLTNPKHVIQLKKGRSEKELIDINSISLEEVSNNETLLQHIPKRFDSAVTILKSVVRFDHRNDLHLKPIQHRDLMMLAYLFNETANLPLCFPKDLLPDDFHFNPISRLRCRIPTILRYVTDNETNSTEDNSNPIVRLKIIYSEMDQDTQRVIIAECFSMQFVAICRPYSIPYYKSVIENNKYSQRREEQPRLCVGMGLVCHSRRDINEIDLLTGVNRNLLNGSCLVKGNVFTPDCLLLNQRELTNKTATKSVPFVSPMITVGIGRTSINTRKSLPKIRRHNH